ncbi:alpha-(1-_3)-arabinofuranosyltransferase family protein [Streptomyces sp. ODS28]|uniref:alpha-(1->3)-arabinofuranosyltransferase n=1 Tax=Streptomyces sp. ODS28 TaxID=3136688 RepID=UPI0031E86FED
MTTTVQAPPQNPRTAVATAEPPPERPCRRSLLLLVWALLFVAFLAKSPGKMTFETKLGVALDPFRFLDHLGELWTDQAGFGGISDQYAGYLFPSLPYYALTDVLHIPTWIAERLWMSLIVAAAFWGALRLAERFGVGSRGSRVLGALVYALWPAFTIVVGSTSAAALPGAVLPWVLLPLASTTLSPRVAAARSALIVPFMGGVNAASTLAALLPAGLYLLTRTGRARRTLLAWWLPGVVLATLWWTIPLLLLGVYGEDFMPYVETARTTTDAMSATEMLRGAGNWTAYLHFGEAWLPAGWSVATGALAILGGALAAGLGLAGLARRDLPERRWLVLTVLTAAGIMLAGYAGSLGAPFAEGVQGWLDGWLRPFRNIFKFQPGLGLAVALGLAHLLSLASRAEGVRPLPGRRLLPVVAAVLVLPGLALPYATGDVLQPGAFKKLPKHWEQTADWLKDHSPDSRAYVTPATAHGINTWGSTIDQPLDVLAKSAWAQRDYVPFGAPGNRRAMDAVEQALLTGSEVPGLSAYLARAGLHYVVVRNDLDPEQIGYVPPQTVRRTLEASGYTKVKSFGPEITQGTVPSGDPLQVTGLFEQSRAVEIFEPPTDEQPGPVAARPVQDTVQVSGGPESLLQMSADPALAGRPSVLTGDNHPGLGTPARQFTADGLRRADTRFGLVNGNTSYTYTANEKNAPGDSERPGEKPKQILPTRGAGHQTVATLRGAASVTASSYGNWLFHLPQFDPVGAFDGDQDTAWAEGSGGDPVGQWIRIGFRTPVDIPSALKVIPLPAEAARAAPTRVRVQTDKGSRTSTLRTDGSRQEIKAPPGEARWLKLTITSAQGPRPGLSGAGFQDIDIPHVQVTRMLRLPDDAEKEAESGGSRPAGETFSLHRYAGSGGLSPAMTEPGLHRQFTTGGGSGEFRVRAKATPVQGPGLDQLLDEVAPGSLNRVSASADSTAELGTSLSARNLVDGDLTTGWIAGDKPTVHLRWPGKKEIDRIVLAGGGGISARPAEVRISSPDGAATASVDENGWARFDPITTDRLDLTVTRTQQVTAHNPLADRRLQLPVGLSEVYVPALEDLRIPPPDPDRAFRLPCGRGPTLAVDGSLHTTKVRGTVRDLTERRPVDVELCAGEAKNGSLELPAGRHTVEAGGAGPLAITDVTLARGERTRPATGAIAAAARQVTAVDWLGDRRSVRVGDGSAAYLQTYENVNDGWRATLDGKELRPLRLDGWQQGFLVPAGQSGLVKLEYRPARWYEGGLIAGVAGVALLLGFAFVRRRAGTPLGAEARRVPPPSWVLGTVALTLVMALVSGPYAVVVPVLALVAWARPALLVPLALLAALGAGVAATVHADRGIVDGQGAFSHVAQALALLALTAALVTAPRRPRHRRRAGDGVTTRAESVAAPTPRPAPRPESETAETEALYGKRPPEFDGPRGAEGPEKGEQPGAAQPPLPKRPLTKPDRDTQAEQPRQPPHTEESASPPPAKPDHAPGQPDQEPGQGEGPTP